MSGDEEVVDSRCKVEMGVEKAERLAVSEAGSMTSIAIGEVLSEEEPPSRAQSRVMVDHSPSALLSPCMRIATGIQPEVAERRWLKRGRHGPLPKPICMLNGAAFAPPFHQRDCPEAPVHCGPSLNDHGLSRTNSGSRAMSGRAGHA